MRIHPLFYTAAVALGVVILYDRARGKGHGRVRVGA